MDKRLEYFLKDLVHQVHGDALPTALEEKMMADLNIQLQQRLHEATLEALPSDLDRIEYQNKVIGQVTPDDLSPFLRERIPDLDSRLSACVATFQQDYIRICRSHG